MNFNLNKIVVIALGGSVVHTEEGIDIKLLRKFRALIQKHIHRGTKFVIVIGGGALCRKFLRAARELRSLTNTEADWLGIESIKPNAELVRLTFGKLAAPQVIANQESVPTKLKYPVTVSGGWRPGWSTDYVALAIADKLGARVALIAGKPKFVYDKNPDKYPNAKVQTEMTWRAYRKIIPAKWVAGAHAPVDPSAAKLAAREGISAIVLDGKNLKNLDALLSGKKFQGTVIK